MGCRLMGGRARKGLINLWLCCGQFFAARVAFMAEYAIISCAVINDTIAGTAPGPTRDLHRQSINFRRIFYSITDTQQQGGIRKKVTLLLSGFPSVSFCGCLRNFHKLQNN